MNDELNKKIDDRILKYLSGSAFTKDKVTDTPTDALHYVNRKYVTNNGTVRPVSSVVGQPFLDMNLASGRGKPIWYNGVGWIDSGGNYV
jgi:hypothetical protein